MSFLFYVLLGQQIYYQDEEGVWEDVRPHEKTSAEDVSDNDFYFYD